MIPPYFLLVAGLLAGLASGKAFEVTLKELIDEWVRTRSTRILSNLQGMQLLLPFLGICGGVCVFSGLWINYLRLSPVPELSGCWHPYGGDSLAGLVTAQQYVGAAG